MELVPGMPVCRDLSKGEVLLWIAFCLLLVPKGIIPKVQLCLSSSRAFLWQQLNLFTVFPAHSSFVPSIPPSYSEPPRASRYQHQLPGNLFERSRSQGLVTTLSGWVSSTEEQAASLRRSGSWSMMLLSQGNAFQPSSLYCRGVTLQLCKISFFNFLYFCIFYKRLCII